MNASRVKKFDTRRVGKASTKKKIVGLVGEREEHRLKSMGTVPTEMELDKIEENILMEMETEEQEEIEIKVAE